MKNFLIKFINKVRGNKGIPFERFNAFVKKYYDAIMDPCKKFVEYEIKQNIYDFEAKLYAPIEEKNKIKRHLKEKNRLLDENDYLEYKNSYLEKNPIDKNAVFSYYLYKFTLNILKLIISAVCILINTAYMIAKGVVIFLAVSLEDIFDKLYLAAKWVFILPFRLVLWLFFWDTHQKRDWKSYWKKQRYEWKMAFKNDWILYVMFFPALIWIIVFWYLPKYGLVIAFQDYRPFLGIGGSPWVGFKHFAAFFTNVQFKNALGNTLMLNIYGILFTFPIPIILALMINEVKNSIFKKSVQTIVFIPYFISTVVICGIFLDLLQSRGLVNNVIAALGGTRISFIYNSNWSMLTYFGVGIYQNTGYSILIYIAALTAVDPSLYEAGKMDGATKMQEMKYITFPSIMPTVTIMLILRIGQMLNAGHERILLLYNPATYDKLDVISTFVYRLGLDSATPQYSFTTAVGLANSLVSMLLVYLANKFAKRTGNSLW